MTTTTALGTSCHVGEGHIFCIDLVVQHKTETNVRNLQLTTAHSNSIAHAEVVGTYMHMSVLLINV